MKIVLAALILMIGMSCNSNKDQQEDTLAIAVDPTDVVTVELDSEENPYEIKNNPNDHLRPYEVKFGMEQIGENLYDFVVDMKLNDGAHFVSPNAKRDFSGKFTMQFDENQQLELTSDLLETPLSKEEIDPHPFVNGTVNWVRENTKYNQRLRRTAEEKFEVKGFIQFTIEPRCTLEKVPFIIKYGEGEMRAEFFGC